MKKYEKMLRLVGVMLAMIAATVTLAHAQEPIALDEIKPGEISDGDPQPAFEFSASPGQNIEIEVLSLSEGMVPQFAVLRGDDALGVWYALSPQDTLKSAVRLEEGGPHRIVVGTTNGTQGQFVITVREVIPPPMLIVGVPVSGPLTSDDSLNYLLESDPANRLTLSIAGQGIEADLSDAEGTLVGSMTSRVSGGFYLPAGSGTYSLEVRSTSAEAASYQLSLAVSE